MEVIDFMPFELRTRSHENERIKKAIPEITQKMLIQQLRELEEDGIITRTVYNQVPPKVVYGMSELGLSLKSILDQLDEWGEQYIHQREWKSSCSG